MWLRDNSMFNCFVDYSAFWQKDVKLQDGNDNRVKSLETVHSVLCNAHNQLLKKKKKIPPFEESFEICEERGGCC